MSSTNGSVFASADILSKESGWPVRTDVFTETVDEDAWAETTDGFEEIDEMVGQEAFPSGTTLTAVAAATGPDEEHWDPNNTGLPLYDTGPAVRNARLSPSFTVGDLVFSDGHPGRFGRISPALVKCLQAISDRAQRPVRIRSGYRSWSRTTELGRRVGKAPTRSRHCSGQAADISISGMSGPQIAKLVADVCGDSIAIGVGRSFVHIDVRGHGTRWTYPAVGAARNQKGQVFESGFDEETASTERLFSPRFVGDRTLEACLQDRARLGAGATGGSVVKIQRALTDLGFDLGAGGVDGKYGPATEHAVRAFKRKERLGYEQYGDVGPGTMKRLDQIFRDDHRSDEPTPMNEFATDFEDDPTDQLIELPTAPASALTIPPEEGDCAPVVAEVYPDQEGPTSTINPCDVAPAPPGSLSEFEIDLRSHPERIRAVVIDPETQEIIGYRVNTASDVLQVVDREGNFVEGAEKGLEAPPIDPIDFVPSPGAVVKGSVVIGKVGLKALGVLTAKGGAAKGWKVSMAVIPRLQKLSKTLNRRGVRAAKRISKLPTPGLTLTEEGINHTWAHGGSKPAQWFGGTVTRETHDRAWRDVINRAHGMGGDVFPWSVGQEDTIAKLVFIDGKHLVLQYSEVTGRLITAFRPGMTQLTQFKRILGLIR